MPSFLLSNEIISLDTLECLKKCYTDLKKKPRVLKIPHISEITWCLSLTYFTSQTPSRSIHPCEPNVRPCENYIQFKRKKTLIWLPNTKCTLWWRVLFFKMDCLERALEWQACTQITLECVVHWTTLWSLRNKHQVYKMFRLHSDVLPFWPIASFHLHLPTT